MANYLLNFLSDADERNKIRQGFMDAVNRGAIATTLGAPVDMLNLGANALRAGYGYAGHKLGLISADQMPELVDKPTLGSEWIGDQMQRIGAVSGNRNALAEGLAGLLMVNPQKSAKMVAGVALPGAVDAGVGNAVYLPHTPLSQNPNVGKRYSADFVGNMAPKTPVKIEDLTGSNIMLVPWDSTSRGYKIKSVSDELLPTPVITTGGQDYARDMAHMANDIGGASGTGIAKRVVDRFRQAQAENAAKGGGGDVYFMPSTMSKDSEFFSSMPTDILMELIKKASPSASEIAALDDALRNAPVQTTKGLTRPFQQFQGILTPEGQAQLYTGAAFGPGGTSGNFRKAFTDEMFKVRNQKQFGFNREDITNAVTDPALMGLPKGMMGNTVVRAWPERGVSPSTDRVYPTNFHGDYVGSLGLSLPADVLMPKTYGAVYQEMRHKYPGKDADAIHSMTLGALEKRKANVSEFVDQQVVDSVYNYLSGNRAPVGLLTP